MQELFHGQGCRIYHNHDEAWLHVNWIGYQTVESVQQGGERIVELLAQYQLHAILNDNSNVLGVWIGASEWVARNLFPRLKESGLHSLAWVYSPQKMAQISIDAALTQLDQKHFGVRAFHDIELAQQWLRQCQTSGLLSTQ